MSRYKVGDKVYLDTLVSLVPGTVVARGWFYKVVRPDDVFMSTKKRLRLYRRTD